jgi:restriction system protein
MTIPPLDDFLHPVLLELARGAHNARTALPGLKAQLGLSEAEMAETIPSGTRGRVFDRADWGLFHLMKAGLVDRPQRGVYTVSAEGRRLLDAPPPKLDKKWLLRYPTYAAMVAAKGGAAAAPTTATLPADGDDTPQEAMERAIAAQDAATVAELRATLQEIAPARFERIIVDLLIAMGYGGGDPDLGVHLGRSGDGGIDGIINEDALGLDAVYVQAKRYDPKTNVGRPDIQRFVGSLTGESATKGVFVTTSAFSREAREYVNRVQQRVVLIDGERLARLMIQHGVGVRARLTYVLRTLDEDYFADG